VTTGLWRVKSSSALHAKYISYWPKLRLALTLWIGPNIVACTVVPTVMKFSHTQPNTTARFQSNKIMLKTKISEFGNFIIFYFVFAVTVLLYGRRCNIRRTLRRRPLLGTVRVSHTPAVGRITTCGRLTVLQFVINFLVRPCGSDSSEYPGTAT
jgi:hypothetical protein